ncbi:MAG: hypothetical protein LIO79_10295 [Rikenellaceae bacterium]|nr:hypothetical protein [Rikenellaceae bacterium]
MINFHENIFITELNQIPSAFSWHQDKELRAEGVARRAKMFSSLEFFRHFPVIILACGHYPKMLELSIEEIFDVEWDKETRGEKQQFYNLHYSKDRKRILVHTRQMSMAVTNKLIDSIAAEIKLFI